MEAKFTLKNEQIALYRKLNLQICTGDIICLEGDYFKVKLAIKFPSTESTNYLLEKVILQEE